MIFKNLFIQLISGVSLIALCVSSAWAAESGQQSSKITEILMDTKLGELEMDVDQASASSNRDVNSVQYKIGFKDGWIPATWTLRPTVSKRPSIWPVNRLKRKSPFPSGFSAMRLRPYRK